CERLLRELPRLAVAALDQRDNGRFLLRARTAELSPATMIAYVARQSRQPRHHPREGIERRECGDDQQKERIERKLDAIRRRDEQRIAGIDPRDERDGDRSRRQHEKGEQRAHGDFTSLAAEPARAPIRAASEAYAAIRDSAKDRASRPASA